MATFGLFNDINLALSHGLWRKYIYIYIYFFFIRLTLDTIDILRLFYPNFCVIKIVPKVRNHIFTDFRYYFIII